MPEGESQSRGRWTPGVVAGVVLLAAGVTVWLGPRRGGFEPAKPARVVVLYCFSALDDVMQDRLLPAFREQWERERGETVEFVATFAGSAEITDRILARYPAEVAVVSSELDAHRLPAPWRSWRELPHGGVLARTPLVVVVRKDNPRAIRGFADLAGEGVAVLHGDPATSGAAELAILAEYVSVLRRGGDREQAFEQLLGIWRNVTRRPSTAREARLRFEGGEGDALITYEADTLGSPSRARIDGAIVYPASTIVAEPAVVKIEKNIEERQRRLIDAFVRYLWTPEAQRALVDYGFHSVLEELDAPGAALATLADPFTLGDAGGLAARKEILERVWRDRVVPQLPR